MARGGWTVGVDFGGTAIKCGLVDARGRVRRLVSLPTARYAHPARFVEGVSGAVRRLAASARTRTAGLRGVGVGAPGPVDVGRGIVQFCVNVPGWRRVPLRAGLQRRLGCPVAVDNDVHCFTLGEWRFGAGRGCRHLIGITLGTGVGGGLLFNGALARGADGAAGEVGHMVIDPGGPRCGCGRRGCLEAFVGTRAILAQARRLMRRRGPLTPELISRAAREGDRGARRVWDAFGARLGLGLANLATLCNPQRIIIGGGVTGAWPWFAPRLLRTVRRDALGFAGRRVRIVRARLGDRAGVVGAAVLVWERLP